jgi:hypothetical protein
VFLDANGTLKRLPRAPSRKRPEKFWQQFEEFCLFYDCFWTHDRTSVLLVAPPPRNLEKHYRAARYIARPSGQVLDSRFFIVRSTMAIQLTGAPDDTSSISIEFAGSQHTVSVQDNLADAFADARVLTTMNKNNDLAWIRQWVDWHARLHGTDTIVMIDNGSTAYSTSQLEDAIASVPGIEKISIISWPYRYGPHDPAVVFHRYWANFLQVSSFNMLFRRLFPRAHSVINCDIDELVGTEDGISAHEAAIKSPLGLVTLKGTWVEPVTSGTDAADDHLAFRFRDKNPLKAICANKWVLDPKRSWTLDLGIMPSVHRIYGIPKRVGRQAPTLPFWHFKAISTNWKHNRNVAMALDKRRHWRIETLDKEISRYEQLTSR